MPSGRVAAVTRRMAAGWFHDPRPPAGSLRPGLSGGPWLLAQRHRKLVYRLRDRDVVLAAVPLRRR